jgi:hypothetical protein
MDVFASLKDRTQIIILTSSFFILTLAIGLLVFGDSFFHVDAHLIEAVKESVKADMLYSTPGEAH